MAIAAVNRWRRRGGESAFLVGVHVPVGAEMDLADLRVSGTIPAGLRGRYLKMGANPVRPDPAAHHWFLGDGMVHGIALEDGRAVWYRNRWILSRLAAAALGRAPAPGPRRGRNDTVNTNVVEIGGRPVAVVEAGSFPVALSAGLETQRYTCFDEGGDGGLTGSFSGHPHRDPLTGEQHAIAYDGSVWDSVRHVVVSPGGTVVSERAIAVTQGPCIHDCAFTARFVVVFDLPVTFSMRAVLGGHAFPFRWNPAHAARVGLLPRDGGDVIWCPVDPCFVFHVANAYDDDGDVVLDVIAYPHMFTSGGSGLDALGALERWTIDPVSRHIGRRTLDATPQEFPRIDERRFGQRHRFVYTVAVPADGNTQLTGATQLYKHDAEGGRETHDFGDGHLPGEFVFIPEDGAAAEDGGWLMGLVLNVDAGSTDLVILDARRFEEEPVAVVHLPHAIPPGFHGNWFADV